MRLNKIMVAAFAALAVSTTYAETISYKYVEGGVGEIDDGSAVSAGVSIPLDPHVYVLGSVYGVDFGPVNGTYVEGGLGYHTAINNHASFFANGQLLYADVDRDVRLRDHTDLGAIARAGVRFVPVDKLELEGALALSSNNLLYNDGLGFNASARYYLAPKVSAAVGYAHHTELDGGFLNVRYDLN